MKVGIVNASFVSHQLCYDLVIPKGIERTCREEQRYKRKVGKMLKENQVLFEQVVKALENHIKNIQGEELNDYKIGLIDGLIIAIRTIEG